jgi:hypothetical protein
LSRYLALSYDVLPPSDNHIRDVGYRFFGGKRRALIIYTKEAENYKKLVIRHLNDHYFIEIQEFVRGHKPWMTYELSFVFIFPSEELLTAGWLKGTAKSPYKKVDTTNRRKLLEDAFSEAIGIDDSLFWEGRGAKLVGGDNDTPAVHMILEEVDPERYGIPPIYLRGSHG